MIDNKNYAMDVMNCSVDGQSIVGTMNASLGTSGTANLLYCEPATTLWGYWQGQYYPNVIKESYPVYIQEKAMDKGKQAFELLKALMDKGLVKVDKVKDFVEAMDTILKTL